MDHLEFQEFKNISKFNEYEHVIPFNKLQSSITQLFTRRLINPRSKYNRMVYKMGTGTGKTLNSLMTSLSFCATYSAVFEKYAKRNAFIIGFSEDVFKKEFLKFPELGIITQREIDEITKMKQDMKTTSGETRELLEQNHQIYVNKIKKRITDPDLGGFYKFFGYRELFNALFTTDALPTGTLSVNIYEMYQAGQILVNQPLLDSFTDSFIICDEIHMAYNSAEMNNYGLALQLILDYQKHHCHAVFLSATIINNNKRELIDIANLVRNPDHPTFDAAHFFSEHEVKDLDIIYEEFKGKVIFLEENNKDYPDLVFQGKQIDGLDFIKFTECMMTPLHEATYKAANLYKIKTSNIMIHDIVVPNPAYSVEDHLRWDPAHPQYAERNLAMVGLFDTTEIKEKILTAPEQWRVDMGIEITITRDNMELTGSWLKYDRLKIFSKKATMFLDIIDKELKKDPLIKILIYHPYVSGSGTVLIAEILAQNGFCHYENSPNMSTNSSELYITRKEWAVKYPLREFFPARVYTLRRDVTETKKSKMLDIYNSPDNKYGKYVKFFLGSKRIKQSIDFKDVQVMFIWQYPTNISDYIQIKGRVERTNSMIALPPEKRIVRLYTFLGKGKEPTIEYKKYYKKISEYKFIQEIERNINKYAVNNYLQKVDFKPSTSLGALPFKVQPFRGKVVTDTYFNHDSHKYAMELISMLIKRAFIMTPVWNHKELWAYVQSNPAANIEFSGAGKDIYLQLFNYCLNRILYVKTVNIDYVSMDLFDISNVRIDRYHYAGRTYKSIEKVITQVGDYFILCPLDKYGNIELHQYSFLKHNHVDNFQRYTLDPSDDVIETSAAVNAFMKTGANKYLFLLAFNDKEQYNIIREHISGIYVLEAAIFKIYTDLKIAGKNWYRDNDSIHKYVDSQWESIPSSTNPYVMENDIVIGIVDNKMFKLKEPQQNKEIDRRKIQRGMTCSMNKKTTLENYYMKLNLVMKDKMKVKSICDRLFVKLIELEIASRSAKEPLRYVYLLDTPLVQ
jgi:hypothetical protein